MGREEQEEVCNLMPGDLVKFLKEYWPRKRIDDTGIMEWKVGVLVEVKRRNAYVLCEGKIETVDSKEIQKIGD